MPIAAARWFARLLGVLTGGFFLVMFIGESASMPGDLLRMSAWDAVQLIGMGCYAVGMLLAVKWERRAVLVATAGYLLHYILLAARTGFSARGALNPFFLLFWIPILLYLACWLVERRATASRPSPA